MATGRPTGRSVQTRSWQSRELADLLEGVIDDYGKSHPSLTPSEISDALRAVAERGVRSRVRSLASALGFAAALLLGGGLVWLNFGDVNSVSKDAVAIALAVLVTGIIVMKRWVERM